MDVELCQQGVAASTMTPQQNPEMQTQLHKA
jgi:hypothetical protein